MSEYNIQMNKYNALNVEYDQLYPQPMKHANTHAKDGSDSITPSMIGTYNKTEIDTALQNKAPAGYGYGEVITCYNFTQNYSEFTSKLDAILSGMKDGETKQIIIYDASLSYTQTSCTARLLRDTNGSVAVLTTDCDKRGQAVVYRKENGIWQPPEYVNPPMKLGVEYRTTERYNGKPVYKRAVNIGDITGDGKSTFESNGATTILSCELLYNGVLPFNFINNRDLSNSWTRYANMETIGSKIEVSYYIGASYGTSKNTVIILRYLKD